MSTPEGNTSLDTSKIITHEHVRQVVRADKGPEAQLSSWGTEDFAKKGDNFATAISRVKVTFILQGKQETSFYVVKINPKAGMMNLIPEMVVTLFEKEAGFYSKILPALNRELRMVDQSPLNVPKCYLTDLESHHELIFLEDLRLRGFRIYDHKKGLDQAHTSLILQELARLHAASLLLQASTPHTDLAHRFNFLAKDWTNITVAMKDFFKSMMLGALEDTELILKSFDGYRRAEQWAANARINGTDIFDRQIKREAPFEVLCHGDCWSNNVVFRYNEAREPVEVMLLDLQVCRVASPATDLAYLLFTSLTGDVREEHLDTFLATYHNTFTTILDAARKTIPFTVSELSEEFKVKEEYGILFGAMSASMMVSEASESRGKRRMKEEDTPNITEEQREMNRARVKNNPYFRSRFLALFESMRDF